MKKAHRSASHLFQRSALWAVLSLSMLGSAQALTLSRPIVQSKQGEALRVEIDISEIAIAEQIDLQATMANPEVYKASKVDVPLVNNQALDIQVQLLRRDRGRPYLKITSKQPVSTNFLDLLIDFRWATGGLLRDVSVSLDDGSSAKKSSDTPLLQSKNLQGQVVVKRGDTASDLMASSVPQDVSLEQMLLALLHSNPHAFVESNINRMKEGALLTLPTEQDAKAVSRDEATRQIQVQTKDFEAYRAELAARAPGGAVPKAARDSAGKLEAKVQNNNAKTNQDKLTLAKLGSKEAAAEEKIAQQRAAQDVATRAAELSRNIAELGKIAAATAAGTAAPETASSGVLPADMPASAASANSEWLNTLREHSLTPVGAGSLAALLVLVGLWRRRALKKAEGADNIHGLPPLDVPFNLDLPDLGSLPAERGYIHDVAMHVNDTHEHPHDHAHTRVDEQPAEEHAGSAKQPARPTMGIPNISLDLDDPVESPYQVRIDLAQELWNLGQRHTSRALMEEVANEATGAEKEQALQWLAERG